MADSSRVSKLESALQGEEESLLPDLPTGLSEDLGSRAPSAVAPDFDALDELFGGLKPGPTPRLSKGARKKGKGRVPTPPPKRPEAPPKVPKAAPVARRPLPPTPAPASLSSPPPPASGGRAKPKPKKPVYGADPEFKAKQVARAQAEREKRKAASAKRAKVDRQYRTRQANHDIASYRNPVTAIMVKRAVDQRHAELTRFPTGYRFPAPRRFNNQPVPTGRGLPPSKGDQPTRVYAEDPISLAAASIFVPLAFNRGLFLKRTKFVVLAPYSPTPVLKGVIEKLNVEGRAVLIQWFTPCVNSERTFEVGKNRLELWRAKSFSKENILNQDNVFLIDAVGLVGDYADEGLSLSFSQANTAEFETDGFDDGVVHYSAGPNGLTAHDERKRYVYPNLEAQRLLVAPWEIDVSVGEVKCLWRVVKLPLQSLDRLFSEPENDSSAPSSSSSGRRRRGGSRKSGSSSSGNVSTSGFTSESANSTGTSTDAGSRRRRRRTSPPTPSSGFSSTATSGLEASSASESVSRRRPLPPIPAARTPAAEASDALSKPRRRGRRGGRKHNRTAKARAALPLATAVSAMVSLATPFFRGVPLPFASAFAQWCLPDFAPALNFVSHAVAAAIRAPEVSEEMEEVVLAADPSRSGYNVLAATARLTGRSLQELIPLRQRTVDAVERLTNWALPVDPSTWNKAIDNALDWRDDLSAYTGLSDVALLGIGALTLGGALSRGLAGASSMMRHMASGVRPLSVLSTHPASDYRTLAATAVLTLAVAPVVEEGLKCLAGRYGGWGAGKAMALLLAYGDMHQYGWNCNFLPLHFILHDTFGNVGKVNYPRAVAYHSAYNLAVLGAWAVPALYKDVQAVTGLGSGQAGAVAATAFASVFGAWLWSVLGYTTTERHTGSPECPERSLSICTAGHPLRPIRADASYEPSAPRPCQSPNDGARFFPLYQTPGVAVYSYRACDHNRINAVCNRVAMVPTGQEGWGDAEYARAEARWFACLAAFEDAVAADVAILTRPPPARITHAQWLERYPRAQADKMLNAWAKQRANPSTVYGFFPKIERAAVFLDSEQWASIDRSSEVVYSDNLELKWDARPILCPSEALRVEFGPDADLWDQHLRDYLKGSWNYAGSDTNTELGLWFDVALARGRPAGVFVGDDCLLLVPTRWGLVVVCIDVSRFDSQLWEVPCTLPLHWACEKGFFPEDKTRVLLQQARKRRVRTQRGGPIDLTYAYNRASGDNRTKVDNSFISAVAYVPLAEELVDSADELQLQARATARLAELGFPVKVHAHVWTGPSLAYEFCQKNFWPAIREGQEVTHPGPRIGRILAKTFWVQGRMSDKRAAEHLRGVALGLWNDSAHIPVLNDLFARILTLTQGRRSKPAKWWTKEHRFQARSDKADEEHPLAEQLICEHYAISRSQLRQFRSQVRGIDLPTVGRPVILPDLALRFARKDL